MLPFFCEFFLENKGYAGTVNVLSLKIMKVQDVGHWQSVIIQRPTSFMHPF